MKKTHSSSDSSELSMPGIFHLDDSGHRKLRKGERLHFNDLQSPLVAERATNAVEKLRLQLLEQFGA